MKKFRINPSLLISMVALFVALGGVSYAAATIGSAQIKNNSVRSKDVKNGDLRGKDLKANTIGGSRVLESSLGKVPSAAKRRHRRLRLQRPTRRPPRATPTR